MSIEDSGPQVHGQFVRIQTYAREASKKAIQLAEAKAKATSKPVKKVWSSSDVLAEALRDPGACGHVMNPEPPTFHFGTEKRLRVSWLNWMAMPMPSARTGKRPRKDTAHMLAGVLSYPDDAKRPLPGVAGTVIEVVA